MDGRTRTSINYLPPPPYLLPNIECSNKKPNPLLRVQYCTQFGTPGSTPSLPFRLEPPHSILLHTRTWHAYSAPRVHPRDARATAQRPKIACGLKNRELRPLHTHANTTHLARVAAEDDLGATRVGQRHQQLRLHGVRALVHENMREVRLRRVNVKNGMVWYAMMA